MSGETVAEKLDRIHAEGAACDRCDKPEVNHSVHLAEGSFYFCDECSITGKMESFMLEILKAREAAKAMGRVVGSKLMTPAERVDRAIAGGERE